MKTMTNMKAGTKWLTQTSSHFWANDDAEKLARALHGALGRMKVRT